MKPTTRGLAEELYSGVEEIEVFVPYSSVMIMKDAKSGGSLVWLAGLDGERDG